MQTVERNTARDFMGIAGRISLVSPEAPVARTAYLPLGRTIRPGLFGSGANWCVQLHRADPGAGSPIPCEDAPAVVTWAGPIYRLPSAVPADEGGVRAHILRATARDGDMAQVGDIEGDFVAAVAAAGQVLLLRSLTSWTPLFYTVRGGVAAWSSNFIDLVSGPLTQLDPELLAFVAWGGNAVPYPDIQTLYPGQYVRLTARGVERGFFDRVAAPQRPPRRSLAEWGEGSRRLLSHAVRDRMRHFRRIGLCLSGGIDSAAAAWCLVDAGADVTAYHARAAGYPQADEECRARTVADMLGIPLVTLDIAPWRLPNGGFLDVDWTFSVPYNHPMFRWWRECTALASRDVDCLVTGFFGGLFGLSHPSSRAFAPAAGLGVSATAALTRESLGIPTTWYEFARSVIPGGQMLKRLPGRLFLSRLFRGRASRNHACLPAVRQAYHYTDAAQHAIARLRGIDYGFGLGLLHYVGLSLDVLRPAGLACVAPFLDRDLLSFTAGIPYAYRSLPYAGRLVDKAVLRRAFLDRLPASAVRANYPCRWEGLFQEYCLNNSEFLCSLFPPDAYLVKLGVIDRFRLLDVLTNERRTRECAQTLMRNAMVELWLRSLEGSEVAACAD